jgi:hypothetical protein
VPRSSLLSFDTDLAWFDAIATRASRRRYDGEPVRPEALQSIEGACRRAGQTGRGEVRAEVDRSRLSVVHDQAGEVPHAVLVHSSK